MPERHSESTSLLCILGIANWSEHDLQEVQDDFPSQRFGGVGTHAVVHHNWKITRILFPDFSKSFGDDVFCVQLGLDSFEERCVSGRRNLSENLG